MHRRSWVKFAVLASFTLCVAAIVAGCGGGPAPNIVWGIVSYTPNDGASNAILEGSITNVGGTALTYAGIVAYAYDAFGNLLAIPPTVSIRGI